MLVSAANVHIRNRTGHDNDGQINDSTMLLPWVEQEARRVRRELSLKVPELYTILSPALTVTPGDRIELTGTTAPFERLVSVERRISGSGSDAWSVNSTWGELLVYEQGSPYLGYLEEGPWLALRPEGKSAGVYRVRYIKGLLETAFSTSTDLNTDTATTPGLPRGMEEVVIERVCAIVATRVPGDDPAPHQREAERIWKDQLSALRRRYVRGIKPGFRRVQRYCW